MRNEYDAYDIWKGWVDSGGMKAVKLENAAASSVPDLMLAMKGIIFLQELKVLRSGSFTMPIFQYAFMVSWRHVLHPWQLSYVVYEELNGETDYIFSIYSVDQIKNQVPSSVGSGGKKLTVNMTGVKPLYIIKDAFEFSMYQEWLLDNAFKRKKAVVNAI